MRDPCRRCGGTEHFLREIPASDGSLNLLPLGYILSVAKLELQVCGVCGLIEWSVPKRFLPDVRKKFVKAP